MEDDLIRRLAEEFSKKKVLVVGLGVQGGGAGVAKFFAELGAEVRVTDLKAEEQLVESVEKLRSYDVKYSLGGHKLEDFLAADIIFKGPSVPWDLPEIIEAQRRGVPVEMEVSFFAQNCPAQIIGVTGTRGKSTTSAIIYDVLKKRGRTAYLAGNVSQTSTINLLNEVKADDLVVLELSSWQLSGFDKKKLSPHISVLTNIYADHLNFYKNMEDYFYDKKAIYLYQNANDYLIANDELRIEIGKDKPKSKGIYFKAADWDKPLVHLRGVHNMANAAAALAVCKILNLNLEKAEEDIASFTGLPYRQQIISKKGNAIFVNDTTSTSPVATIAALKTFSDKPVILILGGNSKNLPYENLINALNKADKIVLLAGKFTDQIFNQLKQKYPQKITQIHSLLQNAVLEAYEFAKNLRRESYILFSPGATSFAMFRNEFDRGNEFNRIVHKL